MSDEDASLDIVIRTRAELEGAESAEAQLDRDIGKAQELGQEYAALEAQLERARAARATGEESEPQQEASGEEKPGVEPDGPAITAEPRRGLQNEVDPALAREAGERSGLEPLLPANDGDVESKEPHLATPSEGGRKPVTTDASDDAEQSDAPSVAPNPAPRDGGAPGLEHDPSDGRMVELQAQEIQAAGERMRAALEQNGAMTLALLSRTIELIEQQNRKLGEMDRQLDQLGSQIKGLKNP